MYVYTSVHCIAAIKVNLIMHNVAHPIETEGDDSEVQTNGTADDAEHGTEDAQVIEGQTENEVSSSKQVVGHNNYYVMSNYVLF